MNKYNSFEELEALSVDEILTSIENKELREIHATLYLIHEVRETRELLYQLIEKINMLDAKTTELLADEDTLEAKVDTLVTGFTAQKAEIANLQTTLDGLQLSPADTAAIQAHIDTLTAKSAAIDTALAA